MAMLLTSPLVLKSGIIEKIIKWAEFKQSEQMAKADGSKIQRY
jgi:hypothetical protein